MIILLVHDEGEQVENMSEVDETVRLVRFLSHLVVVISWELQIVESVLMIFFKIIFDLSMGISARNVLDHYVCSGLISA